MWSYFCFACCSGVCCSGGSTWSQRSLERSAEPCCGHVAFRQDPGFCAVLSCYRRPTWPCGNPRDTNTCQEPRERAPLTCYWEKVGSFGTDEFSFSEQSRNLLVEQTPAANFPVRGEVAHPDSSVHPSVEHNAVSGRIYLTIRYQHGEWPWQCSVPEDGESRLLPV